MKLDCFETKLINWKLNTRHKQLLNDLLLDIALPNIIRVLGVYRIGAMTIDQQLQITVEFV